tara:strand:+ start:2265 stop:2717 length:453 start_codon:yes stop_codon:yes gene_type:complete
MNQNNFDINDLPKDFSSKGSEMSHMFESFIKGCNIIKTSVEVSFVSREEIKKLNKKFRNKDIETNVLSFPKSVVSRISNTCEGEIIICNDFLLEEAVEQNKDPFHHLLHLFLHSLLHLIGFTHDDKNDAILMERKEIELLSKFGIANPYK